MKYHITAAIVNAIIITIVLNLFQEVYKVFDSVYFAKKGSDFAYFFTYSLFFFSWIAPFLIYKIRNYKKHFFYFFAINMLFVITVRSYNYFDSIMNSAWPFKIKDLFVYNIGAAIKETIAPVLAVSILIHISQNFIGKKLLPEKYKPLN